MAAYKIFITGFSYAAGCVPQPNTRIDTGIITTDISGYTFTHTFTNYCGSNGFYQLGLWKNGNRIWFNQEIVWDSVSLDFVQIGKYACVNGNCIQSGNPVYDIFDSLELCQAKCALNDGCDGTCIDSKDWAKIQQLASNLNRC